MTITAPTTAKSEPGQASTSESRVDRDSHFNGLYETKQNLRVEGIAEGEIDCAGTVVVAEGARVKAKVTASTAVVAGELEGEIVCRDVFEIMPSGRVEATVSARRLIVQEGGFYNGEFHMITDAGSGNISQSQARPGKRAHSDEAKEEKEPKEEPDSDAMRLTTDEWWSQMSTPSSSGGNGKGRPSK